MSSSERQLNILIKKRERIFLRLQQMADYARLLDTDTPDKKNVKSLKLMYPGLEKTVTELEELDMKINDLSLTANPEAEPSFTAYSDLYDHIEYIAKAYKFKDSPSGASTSTASTSAGDPSLGEAKFLLNKLEIPDFYGKIEAWPHFCQLFTALVHENRSLSDLHKVSYLVSKLKGNALKSCAHVIPTGENYRIIRELLWSRYNDPRVVCDTYLEQIFNFSPLKTESKESLEKFLDGYAAAVEVVKRLIDETKLADRIFVFQGLRVLDSQSRREFENVIRGKTDVSFQDLTSFVTSQIRVLHNKSGSDSVKSDQKKSHKPSHAFVAEAAKSEPPQTCQLCQFCQTKGHQIVNCRKFVKLSPWERFNAIKRTRLCLRCFSSSHPASACDKGKACSECDKPHHVLLHFPFKSPQTKTDGATSAKVCTFSGANPSNPKDTTIILSTVQVHAKDGRGRLQTVRLLLDSGSQSNFLTTKICKRLSLPTQKTNSSVLGLGGKATSVIGKTHLSFVSRFNPAANFEMEALIVDRIVDQMPSTPVEVADLKHIQSLQLADDSFAKPGPIDGIIGAELFPYLMNGEKIPADRSSYQPMAFNSPLGFIIMGSAPVVEKRRDGPIALCSFDLPELVERFWKLEEVPSTSAQIWSEEEMECEKHYLANVSRSPSGRYCVRLPFKMDPQSSLKESYRMAERRLFGLEKRLTQSADLRKSYQAILDDYVNQGHLSIVENPDRSKGYFIPHHGVYKPQSVSTPLRCVFDASARSSSGLSLNSVLHVGPKLQADIFSLLINFRLFEVALTADIRQMYRQIEIHEEDRKYLQILWRADPEKAIQTLRHNVLVFGLVSSPFLALRVVQQLVEDEGTKFPYAAEFIPRDMYVDDLLSSVLSVAEASQLYREARAMFLSGGFELVKWVSNRVDQIPDFAKETLDIKGFHGEGNLAVLGLNWHSSSDIFRFQIDLKAQEGTKRAILSTIARIYDPLGFLAPVLLSAKCLIKSLWQEGKDWDQPPPPHIAEKWKVFQSELTRLPELEIPRHIGIVDNARVSLVGFADASERGYGGVIYLVVSPNNGNRVVRLLCSKAKVAPSKTQSIPRLELCAALLLSKLIQTAATVIKRRYHIEQIVAMSDSQIVLCWLNSSPSRWQTFVANRVCQIQERSEIDCWLHVAGEENPADCLSRGLYPREILEKTLWWGGPAWLVQDADQWPVVKGSIVVSDPPEEKIVKTVLQVTVPELNSIEILMTKTSRYLSFLKSFVYVLRFLKICPRRSLMLSEDLDRAENLACRIVQLSCFHDDISRLKKGLECSKSLRCLSPFLADDGLLRVGGRLERAPMEFDRRHPILLPKKHVLTGLIIDHYHRIHLHTGPSLLLAILRQKFWIIAARQVVRQRCRSCNVCFRFKPKNLTPKMADLPSYRVNETRAFIHTGVDYAGPLRVSMGRKRNPTISKAYICLFVCMATKAIHLELVSGLSTELFLSAFKRFLSRRGGCQVVYSDNGTNFIGAKNQLDELYRQLASKEYQQKLVDGLQPWKIKWVFSPPNAPHFGGLWESQVKGVKSHLFKVVGEQLLTYEELNSVLVQIEGILNSRPLCPLTTDPAELSALTPAHFLMNAPSQGLPTPDVTGIPLNRLTRYQLLDQLVQSFWKRWRQEYLHELQLRRKWTKSLTDLTPGTLVLVNQPQLSVMQWPLGIIEEVFPGQDGVVRVVRVRTARGSFKRPVVNLYPLPTQ